MNEEPEETTPLERGLRAFPVSCALLWILCMALASLPALLWMGTGTAHFQNVLPGMLAGLGTLLALTALAYLREKRRPSGQSLFCQVRIFVLVMAAAGAFWVVHEWVADGRYWAVQSTGFSILLFLLLGFYLLRRPVAKD